MFGDVSKMRNLFKAFYSSLCRAGHSGKHMYATFSLILCSLIVTATQMFCQRPFVWCSMQAPGQERMSRRMCQSKAVFELSVCCYSLLQGLGP